MDRRSIFFIGAAVVCALLIWPCTPELRWVAYVLIAGFLVLAALTALEAFTRSRRT